MEIRGIHSGRAEQVNAHHATSRVLKQSISAPEKGQKSEIDSLSRSPELLRLAEEIQRVPEVRADLVERVAEKLAAGEYDTRLAAEKTAESILTQR